MAEGTAAVIGGSGGRESPDLPNGNAPHASRAPRPGDRLLRLACRALPPLWSLLGLRTAAAALRHYLRADGAPFRLDARALLALAPVRDRVAEQLAGWRAEASALPHGSYPADSRWRGVTVSRQDDPDLWLALRGFQYRLTGTVEVAGDGTPHRARYRFQAHKSWNFDRGESEYGIPFTPFARLHETGLAREFDAVGESDGLVEVL
ncbi:hypothetical protein ABT160_41210 [Streptomyces sp. NPDC001941]|uniref:hypothetical protein n=1 Tax=Streptomyces sp. NPDC001941 TaxID=3154659 RepID=UPI00333173D4